MRIFEVVQPGLYLTNVSKDKQQKLSAIMHFLSASYLDANLAFDKFDKVVGSFDIEASSQKEYEYKKKIQAIRSEVLNEFGMGAPADDVEIETKTRLYRALEQTDEQAHPFHVHEEFLYAKAFLFALDTFQDMLGALIAVLDGPEVLETIRTDFGDNKFPGLREVRNSAHHEADRARRIRRGRGNKEEEIEAQPMPADSDFLPGVKVFEVSNLRRASFSTTLRDGSNAQVDVTQESMLKLQATYQEVLNSLEWGGPIVVLP